MQSLKRRSSRPGTSAPPVALPLIALVVLGIGIGIGIGIGLAGCRGKAHEYKVRGQVRQLPVAGDPATAFYVAHEAIDDFVDRQGEVVGMDPMTMDFPLAPGVSLAGIAVTDVVEITLRVDWSGHPPVEITGVRKLPVGTQLTFRAARPGGKP